MPRWASSLESCLNIALACGLRLTVGLAERSPRKNLAPSQVASMDSASRLARGVRARSRLVRAAQTNVADVKPVQSP